MFRVLVDEEVLAEIVDRLVRAVDPDRIILFGSRARGEVKADSDVDLLLIKSSDEPAHRREIPAYRALGEIAVPVDILWFTPEEVEEWSAVKYHVTAKALREGRVLYEKQS